MAIFIPLIFLILVFLFSWIAKLSIKVENNDQSFLLKPKSLHWFLVAFSAATTANTGFIITSAIAMGFSIGLYALVLPLSFLLGDLFYWQFFAEKINKYSSETNSRTIPEFITSKIKSDTQFLKLFISICVIISAIMYTIAQWIAAGKIFSGFYSYSPSVCIATFSIIVLTYCLIGGFFSSVYSDIVQGMFMLFLPTITILYCIFQLPDLLVQLSILYKNFNNNFIFISQNGVVFIIGWAIASIGFSFSQPHILDKIIAAKDEANVSKARYIYMFFVQYTWIGMTLLGILIRLLYKDLINIEPERALAIFISYNTNDILKGFVIAGVFATIATTAASLLISISNNLSTDIYGYFGVFKNSNKRITLVFVALLTVIPALFLADVKVFDLTIFAISLGAVLAPCMLIKIFNLKHNNLSLISCTIVALMITVVFKYLGFSDNILYDIPTGIIFGLIVNYFVFKNQIRNTRYNT